MVVPRPFSSFFSSMLPLPGPLTSMSSLSSRKRCAIPATNTSISAMPSPVFALTGSITISFLKSVTRSNLSLAKPSSPSLPMSSYSLASNRSVTSGFCLARDSSMLPVPWFLQPVIRSTLLAAMTKGVLYSLSMSIASYVWGSKFFVTSTTSIARSATAPPLFLRLVKTSWPGVSMNSRPGMVIFILNFFSTFPDSFSMTSMGTSLAPMCWVIAPGSLLAIVVFLTLSSRLVLPWST
ncbi:Uncharacterised protein [uncultured archaeon]|nr:Uncharacterised protein [uncultured archaeon]